MTGLQQAVYAALAGTSGVNTLVGSRVFPDVAPQGAGRPYVVWQEISQVPTADIAGSPASGNVENTRVQVTSWCAGTDGATKARELDYQCRLAMLASSGFKSTIVDARSLGQDPETKLFGFQSDFSVWFRT